MRRRQSTGEVIEAGDSSIWLAEEYYRVFGDGIHRPVAELAQWAIGRGLSDFGKLPAGSLEWIRKLRQRINSAALNRKLHSRGTPAFECLSDGNPKGPSFFTELVTERSVKDDHWDLVTTTRHHKKKALRIVAAIDRSQVSLEIVTPRLTAAHDFAFLEGVVQLIFAHVTGDRIGTKELRSLDLKELMSGPPADVAQGVLRCAPREAGSPLPRENE